MIEDGATIRVEFPKTGIRLKYKVAKVIAETSDYLHFFAQQARDNRGLTMHSDQHTVHLDWIYKYRNLGGKWQKP